MAVPIPGGPILKALGKLGTLARMGRGAGVIEVKIGGKAVQEAAKVFNKLRGGNAVTQVQPGVFVAKSASGSGNVTFRAVSNSGPPTVDVHGIQAGLRKIKFLP